MPTDIAGTRFGVRNLVGIFNFFEHDNTLKQCTVSHPPAIIIKEFYSTVLKVIGSVAILIAFSLSFATSFFLTNAASRSLHADFTDRNYTCSIANMIADHNISCYGSSKESACIQVELRCLDFNDTKLLYEYYHSYYSKSGSNVSYTIF